LSSEIETDGFYHTMQWLDIYLYKTKRTSLLIVRTSALPYYIIYLTRKKDEKVVMAKDTNRMSQHIAKFALQVHQASAPVVALRIQ
jgi:hypothetical protein